MEALGVAVLSLIGVVFNAIWNWWSNRRSRQIDNEQKATATALAAFQAVIGELREELRRVAEDRDLWRREAASSAERTLNVLGETINKNSASNYALGDVIRESITASSEGRKAMQEITSTMLVRLAEVSAGQRDLRADLRTVAETEALASDRLLARLDAGFKQLEELAVAHDRGAKARVEAVLAAIEALIPARSEGEGVAAPTPGGLPLPVP